MSCLKKTGHLDLETVKKIELNISRGDKRRMEERDSMGHKGVTHGNGGNWRLNAEGSQKTLLKIKL